MSEEQPDDPRAEERVGSVLADKWTLEKLLGLGGMGAVYAARHRNGARAAVKLLHPELARNGEVRERFLREGYAANRVEHRSTVKVLDDDVIKDGPDEGAAYLVMELLEGESLDARAERGPRLDEREVLEVLDTVLDVLEAAHGKGVVHRDLKPENLFLAKDPDSGATRLKVLDFGLARIAEAARVTGHGLALGTPAFMSPEQAAGLPDIDGRADLFALGATAFYVFTGRHVHEAETVLQQIIKMAKDPAPPLKSVAPAASDDFCAIIDKALQLDRDARYTDAATMHIDVRAALERRMTADKQRSLITAGPSIPPPARSTNPPPSVAPGPEEAKRGFPLRPVLLLALCGVAWMLWPQIRAHVDGLHPAVPPPSAAPPPGVVDASSAAAEPDAAAGAGLASADLDAGLDDAEAATDAVVLALLDDASAGDAGLDEEEEEEDEDAGARADAAAPPPGPVTIHHASTAKPAVKKPVTKPGGKKKRPKRR